MTADGASQAVVWYRYEDISTEAGVSVFLREYYVRKTTRCGVWIESEFGYRRRFVLRSAKKRYACPTKAEALDSFIARKKRQKAILSARLEIATKALEKAMVLADGEDGPCIGPREASDAKP